VYPRDLFERYRSQGVLIDTNLMLLIAVGTYRRQRIMTFKRTLKYTLEDFALVMRMVRYFQRRMTTPNILTEVDNLLRQLPASEHRAVAGTLRQLISDSFEVYIPSAETVTNDNIVALGLADCATLLSADGILVITDDFRLSNILAKAGRDVVNINHIRTFR
jgi:hypothetical protein